MPPPSAPLLWLAIMLLLCTCGAVVFPPVASAADDEALLAQSVDELGTRADGMTLEVQHASVPLFQEGSTEMPADVFAAEDGALSPMSGDSFAEVVGSALSNMDSTVDVSAYHLDIESASDAIATVINDDPLLFYVSGVDAPMLVDAQTGIVQEIWLGEMYTLTPQEAQSQLDATEVELAKVMAFVDEAPAGASAEETSVNKMLAAEQYIVLNYDYDQSLSIHDAYSFFTQKTGVCQAYMLAYQIILDRLDIINSTVVNTNHTWNMVKLDSGWYHIDVTWDDPTTNGSTNADALTDSLGYSAHQNFLRSDAGITETGHSGWTTSKTHTADSTSYDSSWWRLSKPGSYAYDSAIIPSDGVWYYETGDKIYKRTGDGTVTQIATVPDAKWYVSTTSDSGSYYAHYGRIALYDGRLYYHNGKKIFSCKLDGSDTQTAYTLTAAEQALGKIYGLGVIDGQLKYAVELDPGKPQDPLHTLATSDIVNVTGISVNPASQTLAGTTQQFTATVSPSNATDKSVTWTSSDEMVGTVDQDGLFTAAAAGTATITATSANGGQTAQATVTVASSLEAPGPAYYTSSTNATVTFHWAKTTGATGYRVFRLADDGKHYQYVGYASDTSYTDTGLHQAYEYYYKIAACTDTAVSSPSELASPNSRIGNINTIADTPAAPTASAASSSRISLFWSALDLERNGANEVTENLHNQVNYQVWRSTSADGTYKVVANTTALAYTDADCAPGTTYYYRISAWPQWLATGPSSWYRNWWMAQQASYWQDENAKSAATASTTPIGAPATITATQTANAESADVSWSAVAGAVGYNVYRATSDTGPYALVATDVSGTSVTDAVPIAPKTYYYKVAATGTQSESAQSSATATASIKGLIDKAVIQIPAQTYTGAALEPAPTVTHGGTTLVAGTDYTVAYANNANAGTATMTITGLGNYIGTKSAAFTIGKAAQSAPTTISATAESVRGHADGQLTGLADTMEYRVEGASSWTAVPSGATSVTGLVAGTYHVRYAELANYLASPAVTATVDPGAEPTYTLSITPASTTLAGLEYGYATGSTSAFTVKNIGNSRVTGLAASFTAGSSSFAFLDSGALASTTLDPGATAQVVVKSTIGLSAGTHTGALAVISDQQTSASAQVVQHISKQHTDAPSGLATTRVSYHGADDGSIDGLDTDAGFTYEYRPVTDPATASWTTVAAGKASIDDLAAGAYEVRVKADSNHYASAVASVTVADQTSTLWTRLAGSTALDTMSAIVDRAGFATGGTVLVATSDGYWDALTAAGAAGLGKSAVLLTDGTSLSTQTRAKLVSLKPSHIIVCGGTAAISDTVLGQIASATGMQPTRCAGATATGTACDIYRKAASVTGSAWSTTAIVATNSGYWDALSIAPYAYAKGCPIFLSEGAEKLSSETLATMKNGGITQVYIVGGTAAVSSDVEAQLASAQIQVIGRMAGSVATDTSQKIAEFELSQGMKADGMAVATRDGYWDALTGAALCGHGNSVLVLVADDDRRVFDGFLSKHISSISHGYVFGGTAAVSADTFGLLPR